jgi:hypothetical protein
MVAKWHPANGFDTLVLHLFTGAAFAGCTNFTMANRNIVDIGLHVIKQCSMYAKEYKAWIACEDIHPRIVKTFDFFKSFWAAKITLVNQTAVPTSQYRYGMAATNNNNSVVSFGKNRQKLWCRIRCHPRVSQVTGHNNCINAKSTPYHSTAWHYSNNQPQPTTQRSISVALPVVGMD